MLGRTVAFLGCVEFLYWMGTEKIDRWISLIGDWELGGLERLSMFDRTYVKDGVVLQHVVDFERCSSSALEEYSVCLAG